MKLALITILAMLASNIAAGQADSTQGASLRVGAFTLETAGAPSSEDVLFPDFTQIDGVPFQLPLGFDSMAYTKAGAATHTVFIADGSHQCPKSASGLLGGAVTGGFGSGTNPSGCGIFSGAVGGTLTLVTAIAPANVVSSSSPLDVVTAAWDGTQWDPWVTHGSTFEYGSGFGVGSSPWTWPDHFGATGFLIFHSDCIQSSPCTSTNDLGYNPRRRQVCSHGPIEKDELDIATYGPLPNMGYRNRYCTGSTLGYPAINSPIPVTSAAYPLTSQSAYNDLANMWTVSSFSNGVVSGGSIGSVLRMGPAHLDSSTNCYGGPCPNDGVNHIGALDAHFKADPTAFLIIPVDLTAQEWTLNPNPAPIVFGFLAAAPHDIVFSEDFFDSDGDDDGFGTNFIATYIRAGCVRCSINHSYIGGGIKRDSAEGHTMSLAPPGPMQFIDDWCEGNSICMWGGGGSTPPVCADQSGGGDQCDDGLRAGNVEAGGGIHVTYNPRWLPSPAGDRGDVATISSWACSSGTVQLTMSGAVGNPAGGTIYSPVIFVETAPTGSGLTAPLWYTATNLTGAGIAAGTTIVLTAPGCSAGGSGGGSKVYGFEACVGQGPASGSGGCPAWEQPMGTISMSSLNALSCGSKTYGQNGIPGPGSYFSPCDPIVHQNPQAKNLNEKKSEFAAWDDGEIWDKEGVQAQEGQALSVSSRACSGASKCRGGQNEHINDIAISNVIVRHVNEGLLHDGRSHNGSWGCWGDATSPCPAATKTLSALVCDSTVASGIAIDFVFSSNPAVLNPPSDLTGTDVYIYNVGSDLAGMMPDGWYQTYNEQYTSTIPVYLPAGLTCNPTAEPITSISSSGLVTLQTAMPIAPTAGSYVAILPGSGDASDIGSYLVQASPAPTATTFTIIAPAACASNCGSASQAYHPMGTLAAKTNDDGGGVTPGMHHVITSNVLLYDIGDHTRWNGGGTVSSLTNSSGGNNYSVNVTMGPASGTACTSAGLALGSISAGVTCALITAIDACPAAGVSSNGPALPDCPLLLQAELGDLMAIVCPANQGFSTGSPLAAANGGGLPNGIGSPIIALDPNQQWFTYAPIPPPGFTVPSPGTTASCPLEPPNGAPKWSLTLAGQLADVGSSGLYNNLSYPKGTWQDHITSVGINGANVTGQSFETNTYWLDGILAVPGSGDVNVPGISAGTQACGGAVGCGFKFGPGSGVDTYTGPPSGSCQGYLSGGSGCTTLDSCGITNMGQESALNFQGWSVVDRVLTNYPTWQTATPYCSNDGYAPFENTTPPRVSTPGPSVTCGGGGVCSILNDAPDSIGFVGAMNTNNYPLNLPDFRGYALHSSSPYKAGGILQSHDGLDSSAITPYLINALSRTIRPCPLLAGCPTYFHDGPQYEWLTWSCSGMCSNFAVFEDGVQVFTTSNQYAQIYGLAVNSTHLWNVTTPSGTISNLLTTMY